jgi:hypothetical protein
MKRPTSGSRPGHGGAFFDELCRCPDYVLAYECGGDVEVFTFLKYGPVPAPAWAKQPEL